MSRLGAAGCAPGDCARPSNIVTPANAGVQIAAMHLTNDAFNTILRRQRGSWTAAFA